MTPSTPDAPLRTLAVRFVGSGSEYFRIWIVNLLLIIVTLGLYYPFAKVRRLRYFHGCTELDGHPLAFEGKPWAMLRGYLLVAVLAAAYAGAQQVSELAAGVALLALAAIGPALWQSSLRFRLANTLWRGARLRFTGSIADAYRALLPSYALVLLLVLAGLLAGELGGPRKPGTAPGAGMGVGDWVALSVPLLTMAILPWLLWRMRRYQHDHYAFATEQTQLRIGPAAVYALFARAAGLSLVVMLTLGLTLAGLFALLGGGRPDAQAAMRTMFWAGLLALPLLLAAQAVVRGYITARLQNLFWSATGNAHIRFGSKLRARALIGVMLRNWLLMVITLGLYHPFAVVAQTRVRLQAMVLHTKIDLDALVAQHAGGQRDAAGDAAADLLGIDIGL